MICVNAVRSDSHDPRNSTDSMLWPWASSLKTGAAPRLVQGKLLDDQNCLFGRCLRRLIKDGAAGLVDPGRSSFLTTLRSTEACKRWGRRVLGITISMIQ